MRKASDWFWRIRALEPRAWIGILIAGILTAILIAATMVPYRSPNFGFGPEWDCRYAGQGDPVCIKKNAK